jgi:dTDP-4-dehydrorhamnose 3,5-epimerase-like enzyme
MLGGTVAQRQAFVFPFEAPKVRPVQGTRLVAVPRHADERGFLIALDRNQSLPFEVRRVYCIYPGAPDAVRGEHATSAHCALVALQGSVEIDLDNGREQGSVRLSRTDQALCIHAGVWLRVRDLSPGAIVLVAASRLFAESVYYRGPHRELLRGLTYERWE